MPKPDPEKVREWRKRSKPLERGDGPKRKTPMKRKNPKRKRKLYERNYGDRAAAVRDMHCLVVPLHALDQRITCRGRIVAAHVRARGMGGAKGDRRDLVNLCAKHHDEAGEYRTSQRAAFEAKWGVDLMEEARKLAERLDEQGYE